jgi:Bacteriophage T4-like portal protein (Gp20)
MPDILPTATRQPDSGKSFVASILSKLPYVQSAIEADVNNPKYELFDRLSKNRQLRLMQQSVITGPFMKDPLGNSTSPTFGSNQMYHKYIYAQIDTDKIRRIAEYRRMASYAEVADCLDEICDEFINKDENNRVIKIKFNPFAKLDAGQRSEIEREFYKFINIYELETKGWGYCRRLLSEGELFWENIVHEEKRELGIIGAISVPSELINPVYDNIQNNVIQNFIFQKPISLQNNNAAAPMQQPNIQPNPANSLQQQIITFQGNQITYINSGAWNEDCSIRIPFIESCRRAYKQLSLIEDSIVIYRMVRAPERLKFKIDVGNMPPAKAEAYLKQLMQSYWNKKTYDDSSSAPGGGANMYNPQSMLDSYWFARRNGEVGSDVELLQGGANLGELKDLMYFVNKLYKSLKVPLTRLNPEDGFKDGTEILREELRFAKFIVRLQSQFAEGLKEAFITHLKLRQWWQEYKLHESYFHLEFNPPSNYFAIRKNQEFEMKLKLFSDIANNESISKTFAQRHYLEYNDSRISENMEWLRKDAALKWELDQISQTGPNWREHIAAAENAATAAGGGAPGGALGGGGGASIGGESAIPSGGEPEGGAEAAPEAPVVGAGAEAEPATPTAPSTT